MHTQHRAVISGIGILAANGVGVDEFWATLSAGKSGIGPITLFDSSDLKCQIAGEVSGFDPEKYIDPEQKPKRLGRFAQFGVVASKLAVSDAKLTRDELNREEPLHIVLGVSTTDLDIVANTPRVHSAVSAVPHAATSAIGYMLSSRPSLVTLSDGCASSLDAVAYAAGLITSGRTHVALAGGSEAALTHWAIESMLKCKKCSTRNDTPEIASRPFDRDRDFGVLSEGAAILVVEDLNHAKARGATIYAEILGYGTCGDPAEGDEGSGMVNSMDLALRNSGSRTAEVDYISAHGPSDIDMDRTETRAIKQLFGDLAYQTPISSIKGATGCPMGAGGSMQVAATALALQKQEIPPTANHVKGDEDCDLDYVPGHSRLAELNTALVNTHGFGRGNSSMVLRRIAA
jgi:3-oxoacyl-[acyl-carrier-protein] synthase II